MNSFFCALRVDGADISRTELFAQITRLPRNLEWQTVLSGAFAAMTPGTRQNLRPMIARGRGYVAVGDVYAVPPHTGRGGWTWYTGSAGWMYRAGLESILGFKLQGQRLRINPCVPRWWRDFEITYRRGRTVYRIRVENPVAISRGVLSVELDGVEQTTDDFPLVDDEQAHTVRVVMGEKPVTEKRAESETEAAQKE